MINVESRFQQYWEITASDLDLDQAQSKALFQLLVQAYTESQRFYHTQQHIVDCFELYQTVESKLHDPLTVAVAIWFHDFVYDPKAKDNELQSVIFMQNLCVAFLDSITIEKIYSWILATQKHQPSHDHDLNYLLDIDLAVLGSQPQRFAEYEQQIQMEYAWVNPAIYQTKRREVLSGFYQMKPIYQTIDFQQRYEQQAKFNLNNAINCFY